MVMGTTDVHGRLLPHDYYTGEPTGYGLSPLAPVIDSVRAANPGRTLLLDSGDLLQGNPLAFVHSELAPGERHPVVEAMNYLGYDASAIGNHEFNFGIGHLNRSIASAEFPFLAANIFIHGSDRPAYPTHALLEREIGGRPLRVGITAVTPPGVAVWDKDHVQGRLEFRDPVESVSGAARELAALGADVILVASHGGFGGTSYDTAATGLPAENAAAGIAREVAGIDAIFMGHTHREVADTTINGVLLVQAGAWASSLAVAELELAYTEGGWRVTSKRGLLLEPHPERSDAGFEAALAGAHRRALAYVRRPLGRSTALMSADSSRVADTPIIDFVNQVQSRVSGAELSSAAAFNLEAEIPAGDVTVADIARLYIYDNNLLKAVRISGRELRAYLEKSAEYYHPCPALACQRVTNPEVPGYNFDIVSGVDYALDLRRPVGQRVVRLEYRGEPVAAADSFTLALNSYRQGGGGGFPAVSRAPLVYDGQESIRDLLVREIERRGTISPDDYFTRNWELIPPELGARAYREQNQDRRAGSGPRLRVLGFNDFHGALESTTPDWAGGRAVGGAAVLAAYLERYRAGSAPTVILDAGDVMQGTPLSNLTDGAVVIEVHNRIGVDAAAAGNHEFDWGVSVFQERIAQSAFPWLAANVYVAGSDTLPSWLEPMVLLRRGCTPSAQCDSVTVAVVGLADQETPTRTRPSHVAGLRFGDPAEALNRWVPRARAAGADFVVVTAHEGGRCDQGGCEGDIIEITRRLLHRPDLIVSGDSHTHLDTRVNGVVVVQANSGGTRFSVVDLERISRDSVAVRVTAQPTTFADRVEPDRAIGALVDEAAERIAPLVGREITTLAHPLEREGGEYALGNLIADAQRAATGTQAALMNNGGIRIDLPAGPVTYGDLYRLQPFQNTLVTVELSGGELLEAVEHALAGGEPGAHVSGLLVEYDPGAPAGERVTSLVLETGASVSASQRYTVTVNDFMAEGGSGYDMFGPAGEQTLTGIVDLDALLEYLELLPSPLPVPASGRFTPSPGAEPLLRPRF